VLAATREAGLHASVVGLAKGDAFASAGLFSIPLKHLREMHEAWMPRWIEG
jgi:phosphoribosylformylglycinamidine synthase